MPFPTSIFGLCDEIPSERSGTPFNVTDMSREYTRQFLVELKGGLESGKGYGPIAACSHPLLPLAFAPYVSYNGLEYDALALLIKYDAVQRDKDDHTFWIVTASYSTKMPPGGQFQTPTSGSAPGFPGGGTHPGNNPELEYPDINWSFEDMQRARTVDRNQTPYLNSAGQPFTPAFTRPEAIRVLNISRNELDFNATKAAEYAYALNHEEFLGSPRGFVQCMPPHAVQKFRGQYGYWRVTYKLRFFPRGYWLTVMNMFPTIIQEAVEQNWQPAILDQGYCRKNIAGKLERMLGANGLAVSTQQLLNGYGDKQTTVDGRGLLAPVYILFEEYPYKDMAELINRGFT